MAQAVQTKDAKDKTEVLEGQTAYSPEEAHNNIPAGTRVKVIVNPASGKKVGIITTNSAGVDEVRSVLEANNIQAEIQETGYPGHATELAREAVEQGYDIVIACGGDGTVGEVALSLIGTETSLGILPIGSANNVARMMHVPFDLEEAAKLLRIGEIKGVDVGRCNGRYFLETAGVGLDAALFPILNRFDKGEYIRLIDAARTLWKFRPRSITLILDGKIRKLTALVVLVANGPYWGYSIPLAPDAKIDDGKLDVVVFRNFSKADFIRHIILSLLRRGALLDPNNSQERKLRIRNPKLKTYRAKRVWVFTPNRRRWPVHADAQPRGTTPAHIEVVPAALRVITGPGEHVTTPPSKGVPKGEPPEHRLRNA